MSKEQAENAATIRDGGATVRESRKDAGSTIREEAIDPGKTIIEPGNRRGNGQAGLEFRVIKALSAQGAEADLYIVRDEGEQKVLKVYRKGIDPKREILERYENISRECPDHIVKVFKTGFGKKSGRWYELLEYIPQGSVADALKNGEKFNFRDFVRELGEAVNALHEHGIAHRDLKPANILVRSLSPLNLVLTDFGISSALDGASVRETDRKGLTPMYAAPEDLLGHIVSRPADWWACGMIFYELLLGAHPFQDMRPNRIAFILSTQGVEIDKNLPEDEKMLLSGLLTRNDKKRWGWKQVEAWLNGRRDIPVYYEVARDSAAQPFIFEGKPYYDLHALALAFASGWQQSKTGKGMLARGNVAKWLQNTNQFDEEARVSEEIADNDADLYLFKFLRAYAPELPFTLYGQLITPENILIWLRDGGGEAEKYIISLFSGRKIKKFFPLLPDEMRDPMLETFAEADWRRDVLTPFSAAMAPDKFYWGTKGAPVSPLERMNFAERHRDILSMEIWREKGGPDFIISPDVRQYFETDRYGEAVALLMEQAASNQLLKASETRQKFPDNIYTGSQEEYQLAVGRKNGLNGRVLSSIRHIQAQLRKLEKARPGAKNDILQECDIIKKDLQSILAGQIVWKPGMARPLERIEADLRSLASDNSFRKFFRILFFFVIVPCVLIYFGSEIFNSINVQPGMWANKAESFAGDLPGILAIIVGLLGLFGGPPGAIIGAVAGYALGWIISKSIKGIAYIGGFLIVLGLIALGIWGIVAYFRYQRRREPMRDQETRLDSLKDLRQQVLALRREID